MCVEVLKCTSFSFSENTYISFSLDAVNVPNVHAFWIYYFILLHTRCVCLRERVHFIKFKSWFLVDAGAYLYISYSALLLCIQHNTYTARTSIVTRSNIKWQC